MRRLPGQAARGCVRLLHTLAHVAMALVVAGSVLVAGAAWRLSQGPVDLAWLTQRIEAAANADGGPTTLAIGSTALAWEGFAQGVDRPLDLRLTDVTVTGAGGRRQVDVPRAEVSLSLGALLRGRVEPRAIALDGARLTLRRAPDGTTSVDLGSLGEAGDSTEPEAAAPPGPSPVVAVLAELVRPATNDRGQGRGMFGQLRRIRVRDASLIVLDRQLGATWHAPHAEIDLTRRDAGGVDGSATLSLALGDQTAVLNVAATLDTGAARTHLRARLSPVAPAALARAAPKLTALAALDAPVGLEATLDLGPTLQPESGRLTAHVGAGAVQLGGTRVTLQSAVLVAQGTPALATLETARVTLLGHDGGPPTTLQVGGSVRRDAGRLDAALTLDLDQLAFADLPRVWPEGTGGGARPWLVANITGGVARNGHVALTLAATEDLTEVALTGATGTLDADDLTVHWLRPVPPVEQAAAQLRILDPDTLEIVVSAGRQRGGKPGLVLKGGKMRITGLSKHDQFTTIQAEIAGSVADELTLLKEPRLELLDKHPMDLRDPAGDATTSLTVVLPLENKVRMDDIAIHAVSKVTQLHLGGLVAGRDLDQGMLDIDATAEGLTVKGRAQIAGIGTQLDAVMDFRAGPPSQVLQRVTASGRATPMQLAAAGLDTADTLFGEVPLRATYQQRRAGDAEVALEADLTPVALAVPPTGWRKPVGMAAKASATVLLDKNRLRGIERIAIEGDGISVRGSARAVAGQIAELQLDRALFGQTDLRGSVRLPAGGPIAAELTGASLDLSAKLSAKSAKREKAKGEPPPGPAWTLSARLDRVLLAGEQTATGVVASIDNDGRVMRVLRVSGKTGGTAPFALDVAPDKGVRRVSVTAADAGALLRGLDVVRSMQAGKLSIRGSYDDRAAGHPLTGTAEIEEFRIHGLPALGKLLQAMTLYGMVDVLRGPGIGFTRLVAPFRYDDDGLTLNDARAFSPSLGLTAKGRIDLADEQVDMEGTIVPAYFFNSLLGNIPLIGKLFSPEAGGGVFAARYALRGKLDDPSVSVNPLSALTPGFLREIFGLF